jgi:hypothetical protein
MSFSVAALAVAARRAKDVAALVDAARVLTFLARSRSRERSVVAQAASREHIESIYQTASRLASFGRELAAETDRLLTAAEQAQPEQSEVNGSLGGDVEVLRALLVASMTEAVGAIDMLESIQEIGAEDLQVAPLGTAMLAKQQRVVDQLFERLRRQA